MGNGNQRALRQSDSEHPMGETSREFIGSGSQSIRWLISFLWGKLLELAMTALLHLLRLGPIPSHVAFIMDGNRRYARKLGMEVSKGHQSGADALEKTLDWCLRLGIKTVTVYAFSTENFNRDKEREVNPIMSLCTKFFHKFAAHSELIHKNGVSVRIHGKTCLLPPSVQQAASLATKMTISNSNTTLNICIPYTSREEIVDGLQCLIRGVRDGSLQIDDVDEEVVDRSLWTNGGAGDLDMLIRTSGEVRLSDFMLWQTTPSTCQIHFLKTLWPDFTFWHMLPSLLQYQATYFSTLRTESLARSLEENGAKELRVEKFLEDLKTRRVQEAIKYA